MATMTVRLASINAGLLDTFREETGDGLDRLEARLLELVTRRDPTLVDELFRVVHTIKGGAGTFGMMQMAKIAHRMESMLDAYRAGAAPTRAAVTTLLDGCDALRRLLNGGASLPDQDRALEARLDEATRQAAAVAAPAAVVAPAAVAAPAAEAAAAGGHARISPITTSELARHREGEPAVPALQHTIRVAPAPQLFRQGIDPVMLFDQLTSQGALTAAVDLSAVPPLAELDPTSCHLAWTLTLTGGDAAMIEALFGWLDDVCPITIESHAIEPPETALIASPATPVPAEAALTALAQAAVSAPAQAALTAQAAPPAATIRVRIDKLDALMELVGDLVVTQSALCTLDRRAGPAADPRSRNALDDLQRLTRALQQSALQLRSMPISSVIDRFPRLVHDLAGRLGKQIVLEIGGDTIELDKTVLERIGDPLVHLLRNCIDHGIELPDVREAAGKPRAGRIQIAVEQRGDEVTIEIHDDGRGLDPARILRRAHERGLVPPGRTLSEDEIHRLIFLPGFSTADQVSELSGRGVGMDVVVRTIQELGGDVQLRSQLGAGTTIALRLPLTLAIIEGQLVRFGDRTWVVPLAHVVECSRLDASAVTTLLGQRPMYQIGGDIVPMIDPCERLAIARRAPGALALLVEASGQHRVLVVDELGPRQQVVIKSLAAQLVRPPDLAGAAVLGDGSVAFILDVVSLCTGDAGRSAA